MTHPIRRRGIKATLALAPLCLLVPTAALAAGPPPLPSGGVTDTQTSFSGHILDIGRIGQTFDCSRWEGDPLKMKAKYPGRKKYRVDLGDVKKIKGKMKLRKKPIDDFGDERYIARLKLSSKDERRIKKWVQQLARECTGDSRAKLKIDELIFQIKSTRDNESWFRIPQFEVNGRVISGGETFDLWIVN